MDAMSGSNRRRDNRVDVQWRARVARKGVGVVASVVRNVSIGGACIEARQEMPPQSRVLMEIQAEHHGESHRLLAEGEVMRCAGTPAGSFAHGVRFTRVSDDDLFYLLGVVADLWAVQQG